MKEQAMLAFKEAQEAAVGALYDAGFADGVASVPAVDPGTGVDMGLSAEDEKIALANAVAPLQEQIAALGSELVTAKADLDAVVAAKADVDGKLAVDEALINGLKGSIDKLQGALDFLKALGL